GLGGGGAGPTCARRGRAPRRPAAARTPGRSGRGRGATARGRAGAAPRRICWSPRDRAPSPDKAGRRLPTSARARTRSLTRAAQMLAGTASPGVACLAGGGGLDEDVDREDYVTLRIPLLGPPALGGGGGAGAA